MVKLLLFSIPLLVVAVTEGLAQSRSNVLDPVVDPRGQPELVVCTQNLENYGSLAAMRARRSGFSETQFETKQASLLDRFVKAGCDAIAVQEVLGSTEKHAKESLEQLALALRRRTNRVFETRVGVTTERPLQTGFLIASDRAEIVSSVSYVDIDLPKLMPEQRPRKFGRAPLELQLFVRPRDEGVGRGVTLINVHFKSKHGKENDPAALEWETYRMEMAEAVRSIVTSRHRATMETGENIVAIVGDRNSNFDVASAKLLDGTLKLADFATGGRCRLSKRGVPLCQAGAAESPSFFSVITGDPHTKRLPGTYTYKKQFSWLDDILLPATSLRFARAAIHQEDDYDSGVIYAPDEASDHALLYVKLNW